MVIKPKRVNPKRFRPTKKPRFLPGSVEKNIIIADLLEYNKHRFKVFTAEPKVDAKPLIKNPYDYVDRRKMINHAKRLQQVDEENKELMKQICKINKIGGKVDTYNPHAYNDMSKWEIHRNRMKVIITENKKIHKLIQKAYSEYSRKEMAKFWKYMLTQIEHYSRFPLVALEKIPLEVLLEKQPSISTGLAKLAARPLCFLEFKVDSGSFLGRVIIELYHDHVPVTVQNFLAICRGECGLSYKRCPVHRIVPGRFFETGDITRGTGRGGLSIYGETFDEENHVLKHTKAGVLSMKRIGTTQQNNSQFCITLSKMEQLDKRNVAFGKIIKGADTITKIQGYGRRVGKPLAPVIISNCGEYKYPVNQRTSTF